MKSAGQMPRHDDCIHVMNIRCKHSKGLPPPNLIYPPLGSTCPLISLITLHQQLFSKVN